MVYIFQKNLDYISQKGFTGQIENKLREDIKHN